MKEKNKDNDVAGVLAPPPLIYLFSILVGAAFQYFAPVAIVPVRIAGWLGPALLGLGLLLMALCFRAFRSEKTPPRPDRPTKAIVCAGPYRFSRNPMYLAASCVQIGIGVWANSLWIVLLLLPALLVVTYGVIGREERYLQRKFGEEYLSYKASVRRWL